MPVALIECAGFFQQASLFIGERREITADMHSADHGVCHRKDKIPNILRAVGPRPYTALGRVDEFRHVCGKRAEKPVIRLVGYRRKVGMGQRVVLKPHSAGGTAFDDHLRMALSHAVKPHIISLAVAMKPVRGIIAPAVVGSGDAVAVVVDLDVLKAPFGKAVKDPVSIITHFLSCEVQKPVFPGGNKVSVAHEKHRFVVVKRSLGADALYFTPYACPHAVFFYLGGHVLNAVRETLFVVFPVPESGPQALPPSDVPAVVGDVYVGSGFLQGVKLFQDRFLVVAPHKIQPVVVYDREITVSGIAADKHFLAVQVHEVYGIFVIPGRHGH